MAGNVASSTQSLDNTSTEMDLTIDQNKSFLVFLFWCLISPLRTVSSIQFSFIFFCLCGYRPTSICANGIDAKCNVTVAVSRT